jgi:hypothetical protein
VDNYRWCSAKLFRLGALIFVAITYCGAAQTARNAPNSYDLLLHSSLSQQRAALATVLATPDQYPLAAFELEVSVSRSKNRFDIYRWR